MALGTLRKTLRGLFANDGMLFDYILNISTIAKYLHMQPVT